MVYNKSPLVCCHLCLVRSFSGSSEALGMPPAPPCKPSPFYKRHDTTSTRKRGRIPARDQNQTRHVVCALVVYKVSGTASSFDGIAGFLEYHRGARIFILMTILGGPFYLSSGFE